MAERSVTRISYNIVWKARKCGIKIGLVGVQFEQEQRSRGTDQNLSILRHIFVLRFRNALKCIKHTANLLFKVYFVMITFK